MQAPGSWLNHNRYAYCMQNPVMYTDPNGEIAWFAPIIIGAVIGGGMNLGIKAWNGEINNFADGMKAFCVGAGAGAVAGMASYAMGPAMAGTGFMGGFASGVISSFLGNSVLSIGNSDAFGDPMMSGTQMLYSSLFSGFFGGVANGILAKMAGRNFWSGKAVARDVATSAKPVAAGDVETSPKPLQSGKQISAQGTSNNIDGRSFEHNFKQRELRYTRHIFSDNHIKDGIYGALQVTKETENMGFRKVYDIARYYNESGLLRAGQNQIRIIENGFNLEIKCFLNNSGEIISLDAFVQTGASPRYMGGNLLNIDW